MWYLLVCGYLRVVTRGWAVVGLFCCYAVGCVDARLICVVVRFGLFWMLSVWFVSFEVVGFRGDAVGADTLV